MHVGGKSGGLWAIYDSFQLWNIPKKYVFMFQVTVFYMMLIKPLGIDIF
jgi:hypothetical protein